MDTQTCPAGCSFSRFPLLAMSVQAAGAVSLNPIPNSSRSFGGKVCKNKNADLDLNQQECNWSMRISASLAPHGFFRAYCSKYNQVILLYVSYSTPARYLQSTPLRQMVYGRHQLCSTESITGNGWPTGATGFQCVPYTQYLVVNVVPGYNTATLRFQFFFKTPRSFDSSFYVCRSRYITV